MTRLCYSDVAFYTREKTVNAEETVWPTGLGRVPPDLSERPGLNIRCMHGQPSRPSFRSLQSLQFVKISRQVVGPC